MSRRCLATFCGLLLLLGLIGLPAEAEGQAEETIVGYYAGWASKEYPAERVPAETLTQVNYAFAVIEDGRAALPDPERDGANLKALTTLRRRNPALRVVLSIGGWDDSTYFSDAASSTARREAFAESCLELVRSHDLDGVDLDWEYPVSGGAADVVHRPQDRENFTLLLRALREALDRQGRRDGKRYVLSFAGAADGSYLRCIEPQAAAELADHIFLMTYDFHGPWDSYADFNAPLYTPEDASPQYRSSVDVSVSAWLRQGVPAKKLVLGMPLYGYLYQGVSGRNRGLYSRFSSARSVSYDAIRKSWLNGDLGQYRHEKAQVPYLYGNGRFLSYEDEISIAAKADLARARGLGGVGFWELSQDSGSVLVNQGAVSWRGTGFRDVPREAWYAEAVMDMTGVMNGTSPGLFSPQRSLTRGQTAAILHRMAGEPAAGRSSFSDVGPSAYYAQAAAWAQREGIVQGYADGTFRPNQAVSRQQLAAFLWRYAVWAGADDGRRANLQGYVDAAQVGAYAREPLSWALAAGIVQGKAGGRLDPTGPATRAQTAVMLSRFRAILEK